MTTSTDNAELPAQTSQRAFEIFSQELDANRKRTDRRFAWLMFGQWLAGIFIALVWSPKAWEGLEHHTHIHVWSAIFLGGIISFFPIILAWRQPGQPFTRHVVAIGQMLTSALLIHLSGGRLETHFHIFGSLAFIAFYQDWRVLLSATAVVALDHAVRGAYWPQSVFGILESSPWRWIEHAAWVLFEDAFLLLAIKQSLRSMLGLAERQAALEGVNVLVERTVTERTEELRREIAERRRAERQLGLEYAVSRIVAESSSFQQTAQKVLSLVGESLGQEAGLLWMVDNREGVLRCAETWRADKNQKDGICAASEGLMLKKGADIPGRVWANGEPVWMPDIRLDKNFQRAEGARRAGVQGTFAFPIVGQNGISGVVEFFSRSSDEPEAGWLRACSEIGAELGRSFESLRVQEHLRQTQKMETVGKMAGGIAHEFNSIMTAIIGQSDMLLEDLPAGGDLRYRAGEIGKAASRAAVLTRQLLAYGRKQILRPETLNLNNVIEGMADSLRHIIGSEAELSFVPSPSLKMVHADAGQIEQVILNIAMNAADAMPNGGKFTIETANLELDPNYASAVPDLKPGRYVMVALSDTGSGMTDEVKARAFEPFFTTKDIGKGTGLGLSTCHGIVKQSGGHISVYSELARGTTVKIYLPQAVNAHTSATAFTAPLPLPRGTETILMVEDDPALHEMNADLLRRLGYKVLTATNGVEALKITHQEGVGHIDLLFTDIVMPQMSGTELSERTRRLHPQSKILFTTAYTEKAVSSQGVLDPNIDLLQKPFSPAVLARKIRSVLDTD